jgi:hypothetical protein
MEQLKQRDKPPKNKTKVLSKECGAGEALNESFVQTVTDKPRVLLPETLDCGHWIATSLTV